MPTVNVAQVMSELGPYVMQNPTIMKWPQHQSTWMPYIKKIMKVDGTYPAFRSRMTHVVQEFKAVWNPLGETKIFAKKLETKRHKVNLPIQVEDVYKSWHSDLKVEGRSPAQQPITLYILALLREMMESDIAELENTGVYTADEGAFGFSMDGIATLAANMLIGGNPYRIPLPAFTEENSVHWFETFVRMIPSKVRKLIKEVHAPEEMVEAFQYRYRDLYGKNADYTKDQTNATWLKSKTLVPHDGLDGTECVLATPPGNLVALLDELDPMKVTDMQIQDYDLKVFAQGSYALDFYADELVFIADIGGTTRGLPADQALYYPEVTNLTPIPLPA